MSDAAPPDKTRAAIAAIVAAFGPVVLFTGTVQFFPEHPMALAGIIGITGTFYWLIRKELYRGLAIGFAFYMSGIISMIWEVPIGHDAFHWLPIPHEWTHRIVHYGFHSNGIFPFLVWMIPVVLVALSAGKIEEVAADEA